MEVKREKAAQAQEEEKSGPDSLWTGENLPNSGTLAKCDYPLKLLCIIAEPTLYILTQCCDAMLRFLENYFLK